MAGKAGCSIATASGLHLGQTQAQVIAILGLPTRRSRNLQSGRDHMTYSLEARKKTEPQELARRMQQELKIYPDLSVENFHLENDFYFLEVYIQARFLRDALTDWSVSWSAQD